MTATSIGDACCADLAQIQGRWLAAEIGTQVTDERGRASELTAIYVDESGMVWGKWEPVESPAED